MGAALGRVGGLLDDTHHWSGAVLQPKLMAGLNKVPASAAFLRAREVYMSECPEVRDWMTPNPIWIGPKTVLTEAHQLMTEHNIRRLPVLEGDELVGIVTLGDVRGAEPSQATSLSIWELHYLLGRLTVDEIMSRKLWTVSPETSIAEAARLMLDHRIAGLPVVEDKALVGIITESDIFRMVVAQWRDEAEPVAA